MSQGFQWLLTYLVHSTVLLGCAAALDWRRRLTKRGVSSSLWRIALFGGFISASLQPALWNLFAALPHASAPIAPGATSLTDFPSVVLPPLQADAIDIAPLLVPLWLGIAACGLVHLTVALTRLARRMSGMPVASSPTLERAARELSAAAGIALPRLRVGAGLQAAFVAPGRVVCVPDWMLEGYAPARLRAVLAHELAHLRRHDNAWRIASRVAWIVGWLQPLNALATKRLNETAELACDAWSSTATGLRHELARSLEDCARRIAATRMDPALTTGVAADRFTLLERVTRLLEGSRVDTRIKWMARASSAAVLAVAVAGTFFVVSTLDDDVPPRWLAGNGLYQSLRNIDQDVHRSRSVIVRSPDQYVYVRVTEDFSIEPVDGAGGRTGSAVIAEVRDGVTRSVRYERGAGGELELTYRINGHAQQLDAAGARWLESMKPIAAPAFSRS